MKAAYYNEIDSYAAQWLRNLIDAGHIARGDVDERSIVDVRATDLAGYEQCHFFAGIGGWSYALRLAGWPDGRECWTGSCPCQPLSSAGQQRGHADERHLWPAFHRLITECRPAMVFGEQVASKDGREWLAAVRADLEGSGYAVGAANLPACSVGAPHIRQRTWFVADRAGDGRREERADGGGRGAGDGAQGRAAGFDASGDLGLVADADAGRGGRDTGAVPGAQGEAKRRLRSVADGAELGGATGLVADADGGDASAEGLQRGGQQRQQPEDGGTVQLADANATGRLEQRGGGLLDGERAAQWDDADGRGAGELADPNRVGRRRRPASERREARDDAQGGCERMGDAGGEGLEGQLASRHMELQGGAQQVRPIGAAGSPWSNLVWLPCTDGKARPTQSGVQQMVDGLSRCLGRLCSRQKEEVANASKSSGLGDEVLFALQQGHDPAAIWQSLGRCLGFSEATVLFAHLCEHAGKLGNVINGAAPPIPQECERAVRSLQGSRKTSRPSHGWEPSQQRAHQFTDALRVMSQETSFGNTLRSLREFTGMPLACDVPNRVGRLRAYGNAIVPQTAAEFIKAAMP